MRDSSIGEFPIILHNPILIVFMLEIKLMILNLAKKIAFLSS